MANNPLPSGTHGMGKYEILGPFATRKVVLAGREVPDLQAWTEPGTPDKVWVAMGNRILDIPADDSARIIHFIADAIAWSMGYTCHPSADMEPVQRTPFPAAHVITSVRTDTDVLAELDPEVAMPGDLFGGAA